MKADSPVLLHDSLGLEETTIAKDQPEYIPLPAVVDADGVVTTRWSLTWRERLRLIFGGSVYLQTWTFNQPLQPIMLSIDEPKFERVEPTS